MTNKVQTKEEIDALRYGKDLQGSANPDANARLFDDMMEAARVCKTPEAAQRVTVKRAEGLDVINAIVVNPHVLFSMQLTLAASSTDLEQMNETVKEAFEVRQRGGVMPGEVFFDDVPVVVNDHVEYIAAAVIGLDDEQRKSYDDGITRHEVEKAKRKYGSSQVTGSIN